MLELGDQFDQNILNKNLKELIKYDFDEEQTEST